MTVPVSQSSQVLFKRGSPRLSKESHKELKRVWQANTTSYNVTIAAALVDMIFQLPTTLQQGLSVETSFRPDHNHRIISYPYYTKYQGEADKTFFRHIDLNIPRLVKDFKGASLVQGSVSLDSERSDDCTEMLLGMQYHLGDWWKDVQARLQSRGRTASDGLIHRITHLRSIDRTTRKPCRNLRQGIAKKGKQSLPAVLQEKYKNAG